MNQNHQSHHSTFTKISFFIIFFLFFIIVILSLFVFNILPFFSQKPIQLSDTKTTTKPSQKITTKELISSTKPKIISNKLQRWQIHELPNNKIHVLDTVEISASLSASFYKNVPSSSSAGIVFSNGLEEKDIHSRKISFYYYLKTQQWLLQFKTGEITEFYSILPVSKDQAYGTFVLSIAADGKNILITLPDKTTKLIHFPTSLYEITNQMKFYALTGPESTITISKLHYKTIHK